jgi:hypothetical protein
MCRSQIVDISLYIYSLNQLGLYNLLSFGEFLEDFKKFTETYY